MDQMNWEMSQKINQEKLSDNLLCPPSPNTSCPSSPGSQRQFVGKLVEILNDMSNSNLISWNQAGTSFIVKDTDTFSQVILPKYFKTNNFNSFVRQLNMYNFHKVKNANTKGTKSEEQVWEFENENFIRDKPHLLINIKRKANEKDNGVQAMYYELQNSYNQLFNYVRHLKEELDTVNKDNQILKNMIDNLKNYTDKRFDFLSGRAPNNLLNVPDNKYPGGGITSPHLNENHITSSPFIVGSNDNIRAVITANSPLASVMQTSDDDYANRLSPVGNLSPNIINAGGMNPQPNVQGYLGLGNNEFSCLSPNNSDISEGVRSNQSGIGYLEGLPE